MNAPLGKGLPVENKMMPLICIPTTAGTGSEATGTIVFDDSKSGCKTGITSRNLKPTIGLIDPIFC